MKYPEISDATRKYWTQEDFDQLDSSKTIREVFCVAQQVLNRMPDRVAQVCGPVTNGGKGGVEANLNFLSKSISKLQKSGIDIFDQMPFEETFHRIVRNGNAAQEYENILADFYEPLFHIGKVKTLYFVPGWESSRGAKWEHAKAQELGMTITLL